MHLITKYFLSEFKSNSKAFENSNLLRTKIAVLCAASRGISTVYDVAGISKFSEHL